VVFEGSYDDLVGDGVHSVTSLGSTTARYLRGELQVRATRPKRAVNPKQVLKFFGARTHNLKNINVEFRWA